MITYLLPLLIGYTGGKLVGGERGGVVGAITTMGVIVGADMPMFLGSMIAGPLGGWCIKHFDRWVDGKIKSGFEMLVNNFSAGIIGMILAILAFLALARLLKLFQNAGCGRNFMVVHDMLPLASIFVEPAKILFLNNAINHGIFSPLGIQQSHELGKSIFFLIELTQVQVWACCWRTCSLVVVVLNSLRAVRQSSTSWVVSTKSTSRMC